MTKKIKRLEKADIGKMKTDFIDIATRHLEFTLEGNYKSANKLQKDFLKIYRIINNLNREDIFIGLLPHPNDGVRLWAATALLKTNPEMAVNCLKELMKLKTITSSDATMTLNLWKQGELELL